MKQNMLRTQKFFVVVFLFCFFGSANGGVFDVLRDGLKATKATTSNALTKSFTVKVINKCFVKTTIKFGVSRNKAKDIGSVDGNSSRVFNISEKLIPGVTRAEFFADCYGGGLNSQGNLTVRAMDENHLTFVISSCPCDEWAKNIIRKKNSAKDPKNWGISGIKIGKHISMVKKQANIKSSFVDESEAHTKAYTGLKDAKSSHTPYNHFPFYRITYDSKTGRVFAISFRSKAWHTNFKENNIRGRLISIDDFPPWIKQRFLERFGKNFTKKVEDSSDGYKREILTWEKGGRECEFSPMFSIFTNGLVKKAYLQRIKDVDSYKKHRNR